MVRYLPGALIDGRGIEQLDRVDDAGVQSLSAWGREACKQGLPHKFMGGGMFAVNEFRAEFNRRWKVGFGASKDSAADAITRFENADAASVLRQCGGSG